MVKISEIRSLQCCNGAVRQGRPEDLILKFSIDSMMELLGRGSNMDIWSIGPPWNFTECLVDGHTSKEYPYRGSLRFTGTAASALLDSHEGDSGFHKTKRLWLLGKKWSRTSRQ